MKSPESNKFAELPPDATKELISTPNRDRKAFLKQVGLLITLQALDVASTQYIFAQGGVEVNPVGAFFVYQMAMGDQGLYAVKTIGALAAGGLTAYQTSRYGLESGTKLLKFMNKLSLIAPLFNGYQILAT